MSDLKENIVRARIGIGLQEDVTSYREITVGGVTLYGEEHEDETHVSVYKFAARAPIGPQADASEINTVLGEVMRFLPSVFEKFDDALAIRAIPNSRAREILSHPTMLGKEATLMDVIMSGGKHYRIRKEDI